LRHGNLRLHHFSGDLIFIMKAFTPRTRDIGDMNDLLFHGAANVTRVADLVRKRIRRRPYAAWIAHFYQGVQDLAAEHDVDVGWADEFEDAATDALIAQRILAELRQNPYAAGELASVLRVPKDEIEGVLLGLQAAKAVDTRDNTWIVRHPPQ
jgi:hypothetical protein